MNIIELRNAIIEPLQAFCGRTVFPADDMSEKPSEPHVTYKITMPYGKGTGQPIENVKQTADGVQLEQVKEYRATFSLTAYAMDEAESVQLAQDVYDWFAFHGNDLFTNLGVTIADQTDISNRDTFIVENYERRNGFDVIIRVMQVITRDVGYFTSVEGITD